MRLDNHFFIQIKAVCGKSFASQLIVDNEQLRVSQPNPIQRAFVNTTNLYNHTDPKLNLHFLFLCGRFSIYFFRRVIYQLLHICRFSLECFNF